MTQSAMCSAPIVQRKLIYFKGENYDNDRSHFLITAWPWGTNCLANGYNISLAYAPQPPLWGDDPTAGWDIAHNHIMAGVWYYLEVEAIYNTAGRDVLRVWLGEDGGTAYKILDRSDLTLRTAAEIASGSGIWLIEYGRQVDLSRQLVDGSYVPPVDEHRYLDDIVFAGTYIGPMTGGNRPPANATNTRRTDTRP